MAAAFEQRMGHHQDDKRHEDQDVGGEEKAIDMTANARKETVLPLVRQAKLELVEIEPLGIAAYIDHVGAEASKSTVKQRLAAMKARCLSETT
jgi:hypothetical protein